jgi:hypothetical protein
MKWVGNKPRQGRHPNTFHLCEKKMCGNVRGRPQNPHTQLSEVCSHSSNFEILNYFGTRFEGSNLVQIGHFFKGLEKYIFQRRSHF